MHGPKALTGEGSAATLDDSSSAVSAGEIPPPESWGDAIPVVPSSSEIDTSDDEGAVEGSELPGEDLVIQLRRELARCRDTLDRQCIEKSKLQGELQELRAGQERSPARTPGLLATVQEQHATPPILPPMPQLSVGSAGSAGGAASERGTFAWSLQSPSALGGGLPDGLSVGLSARWGGGSSSIEAEWRSTQQTVPLPCAPPPSSRLGSVAACEGRGVSALHSPSALPCGAVTPSRQRAQRAQRAQQMGRGAGSPQAMAEQWRAVSAQKAEDKRATEAAVAVVRLQCNATLASALAAKDAECAHKIQQALSPQDSTASATTVAVEAAVAAAGQQHAAALSAREAALRREARGQVAAEVKAALCAQQEELDTQLRDREHAVRKMGEQLAEAHAALAALREGVEARERALVEELSALQAGADRRTAELEGALRTATAAGAQIAAEHRAEIATRDTAAAAELGALASRLRDERDEAVAEAVAKAVSHANQQQEAAIEALEGDMRAIREQTAPGQTATAVAGGKAASEAHGTEGANVSSALRAELASVQEQCQSVTARAKAQEQLAVESAKQLKKLQDERSAVQAQHAEEMSLRDAEMAARDEQTEQMQSEAQLVLEALKRNHEMALQAQTDEHTEWLRASEANAMEQALLHRKQCTELSSERDEAVARAKSGKEVLRSVRQDLEQRLRAMEMQHQATLEQLKRELLYRADEHREAAKLMEKQHQTAISQLHRELQSRANEHRVAIETMRRDHANDAANERAAMRQDAARERADIKSAEDTAEEALRRECTREVSALREEQATQRMAHASALAKLQAEAQIQATEHAALTKERDDRVNSLLGDVKRANSHRDAALASAENFAQQLQALLRKGDAGKAATAAVRERRLARENAAKAMHTTEQEVALLRLRQMHQQELRAAQQVFVKELQTVQEQSQQLQSALSSAEVALLVVRREHCELSASKQSNSTELKAARTQHSRKLRMIKEQSSEALTKQTIEHSAQLRALEERSSTAVKAQAIEHAAAVSQLKAQLKQLQHEKEQQAKDAAQEQAAVSRKSYQDGLYACGRERDLRMELQEELLTLKAHIRVFCRIRPPAEHEIVSAYALQSLSRLSIPKIEGAGYGRTVRVEAPIKYGAEDGGGTEQWSHQFDRAFGPETTQEQLYSEVSLLVASAVDHSGCATIFAYGATGAGKTYTMGSSFEGNYDKAFAAEHRDTSGIIPRAIEDLWRRKEEAVAASPGKVPQQLAISGNHRCARVVCACVFHACLTSLARACFHEYFSPGDIQQCHLRFIA